MVPWYLGTLLYTNRVFKSQGTRQLHRGFSHMPAIKFFGAPGTGKTYRLIEVFKTSVQKGILPNEIVVCTFRKSAAQKLINNLELEKNDKKYMGTIHSICYQLLGYPNMLTNADLQTFCSMVGLAPPTKHSFNWQDTDNEPTGKQSAFFNLYGWMKNTLTPLDKITMYPHIRDLNLPTPHIKSLIKKYEDYKKESGKIDFTDQITKIIEYGLIPDGARVLLVDEFQDLTPAQFEVFKLWAENMEKVAIAGDPNQTVYPFWGATSKYFTEYKAEERILSTTHRVPVPVWNTARKLLELNGVRVPDVKSDKEGILKRINHKQAEQAIRDYINDTLHLIRSNYQGVAISYLLADAGIIYTGLNPWTDSEINLFNGIVQLRKMDSLRKKELLEVLKRFPNIYFNFEPTKKTVIESIEEDAAQKYSHVDINKILQTQQTLLGPDTLYDVVKSIDPTAYMVNTGKLFKLKISRALGRYNQRIQIDDHTVKISTIHGAKGGEADTVFLHTAITSKIKKAMRTQQGRQDEARIFFVGLTRTAQTCFVIKDKGSNNYNIPVVTT